MLNWLCQIFNVPPLYKNNPTYKVYHDAIKKKYTEGTDHRLPFLMRHIISFTKSKWTRDKREGTNSFIYNNLVEITIAQLYWFTCSRPCEILPRNTKKTRGIKFKHLQWVKDKEHKMEILRIQIESYKNQTSKRIFKTISLSTTTCFDNAKKHCNCQYLNPYELIRKMIKERKKLVAKLDLEYQAKEGVTIKRKKELKEILANLRLTSENYVFVRDNGQPVRTGYLKEITEQVVEINKISQQKRYKPYSFRIGGTTRASMVGIDHTVILKYVGWKNSRLADCAQRYMRYPEYLLSKVPFEMLHGVGTNSHYRRKPTDLKKWKIYDPWSEKTDFSFYK